MAIQARTVQKADVLTREEAVSTTRILAIDALRGLAMLFMALDHASFFVGAGLQAESYGGQFVTLQSIAYWGLGLVTNLASPIFWLLSGYSLALFSAGRQRKGWSNWAVSRYMLIRAAVILVLDLTICWFFWMGDAPYVHVLTAIAVAMVMLSLLRLLPKHLLAIVAGAVLLGYQWVIGAMAPALAADTPQGFWQAFWLTYSYDTVPAVGFPILGWGPLMWLGYALGALQGREAMRQPRTWLLAGIALLGLWLGLRLLGGYGDLGSVGQVGGTPAHFLIMSKAPPSLTYFAFNLGLAALILAGLFTVPNLLARGPLQPLVTIGQVALFFYVAHIVVYHFIARIFAVLPTPGPAVIWGCLAFSAGLLILVPLSGAYRDLRKRYPKVLNYL
ncbi:DUF1624 domain-containing protein [Candidatus Chloroploca sp. M-50]|uniref:DUF1624 domain-containing protein n=1 Tax=Candidatus Chloroploca mongolica TaxID=2528176 RepID=A0ABS4D632_9CHLR|nr:acyltransferase family protein [Candidatus Chloroploca mongolica]MBP1464894.1 DUF1624 domain-containing protein [Candidatus Chloroploca mongolica]